MSGALRPTARPGDERLRGHGLQIIMRLHAVIRVGRSYQVENAVFRQQLEAFVEAVQPVFEDVSEALLVSLDNDLYLNGVRLPLKASNLRFHQAIMEELARRRVAGVRIVKDVDEADLERFFRYFLQPDAYRGPDLLRACASAGNGGILPIVSASTESGEGPNPLDPSSYPEFYDDAGGGDGGGPAGGDFAAADPAGGEGDGSRVVSGVRPAARKSYSLAMLGARSVLTTTALENGMEMRHAKRVVQPLIDGAFANEPVVVGLSTLSHHDEYTYAHSVNVCLVAVTMGHVLGLDRRSLADLGVASLLHDVGKATVYDRIQHALEEFDAEESTLAVSHTVAGAKLIARSTTLNAATLCCMRIALEHHAPRPADGAAGAGPAEESGEPWTYCYPALPPEWRTSRLSQIVSVADAYVSLLMHRSTRGREVTPYVALGMMLGPLTDRFDPLMLWALVRTVGFYPPGQLVELSDGAIAVVLAPNPEDLARPHVRIVVDECGVPYSAIEGRELRPLPASLAVRRALPASEYPEIPALA